jgi:anti-anti-sigma factor
MMRIVEEGSRKIAVLKLIGDPLGEHDAKTLRRKIHDLSEDEIRHVIFDMSGVKHINSAGLGGLISAMFTMLKAKGEVRFACIGDNVDHIFKMTHLDEIFISDPTVESALKNYQK